MRWHPRTLIIFLKTAGFDLRTSIGCDRFETAVDGEPSIHQCVVDGLGGLLVRKMLPTIEKNQMTWVVR